MIFLPLHGIFCPLLNVKIRDYFVLNSFPHNLNIMGLFAYFQRCKCIFLNVSACSLFKTTILPLANLTGHTEKVGMENFELLKVLGTGGKCLHEALNIEAVVIVPELKRD